MLCEMLFNWDLSDVSLMFILGLCVLGKTMEVNCYFHYIIYKGHPDCLTYHSGGDDLAEVASIRFPHCQFTLLSLFSVLFGGKSLHTV